MNEDLRFMAKEPENNEELEIAAAEATPDAEATPEQPEAASASEEAEAASTSEAPRSSDSETEAAASDASASDADATPHEPAGETAEEPAAEEPAADEPPVEEPVAEEPAADDAPAEEPAAEEPVAESAPDAPVAEPVAVVPPKERRHLARAAKAAQIPARPPRTAEERQAERVAERERKAKRRSIRRKQEREKARAQRGTSETPDLAPRPVQHAGKQKTRQGLVVSDRASKTISVRIDVARRHPRYQKIVRTSTTLHAHDEREDAHIGDTVTIQESRPLSRTKRWRLVEVLERAK
jgi:small subunit ribosomal protein S17